ncbi:MAG: tetratricopeptide repeat protein [Gammaproteobacteria bacterium]
MDSTIEHTLQAAMSLFQAGSHQAALDQLRDLHRQQPDDLQLRLVLGALEVQTGNFRQGRPHLEAAMVAQPGNLQAATLLGSAYRGLGETAPWVALWQNYRRAQPDDPSGRLALAEALLQSGEHAQANSEIQALCRSITPDHELLLAIGTLYHTANRPADAVAYYRRALALQPGDDSANQNLAAALQESGAGEEAEQIYLDMLKRQPDRADVLRNLGTIYKDRDDLPGALECYHQAMMIRRRRLDPQAVALAARDPGKRHTTLHSLRLELEQLEHLASIGVAVEASERLRDGYRQVIDELASRNLEGQRVVLDPQQFMLIGEVMQKLVHLEPTPALDGGALNRGLDFDRIQADYRDSGPGVVVVDDLLRPEALAALRRYLHRSTVWFGYGKARGYCGSYMEDGFGNELLLQVAAEMRRRMPQIVGPHFLNQMWAYIYDQSMTGITAHADPAAVNLNFWLSPDDANLDPESGGLIVSLWEAPREWNFHDYNNRPEVLDPYVTGDHRVVVPHRCNRLVMFNSNLVHKTDDFRFKPGFENRRINVTMLFGRR